MSYKAVRFYESSLGEEKRTVIGFSNSCTKQQAEAIAVWMSAQLPEAEVSDLFIKEPFRGEQVVPEERVPPHSVSTIHFEISPALNERPRLSFIDGVRMILEQEIETGPSRGFLIDHRQEEPEVLAVW